MQAFFNTLRESLGNRKTLEDVALAAIVVLVGTACFGLGRLSVSEEQKGVGPLIRGEGEIAASVSLLNSSVNSSVNSPADASVKGQGSYVASRNGTRYYPPECAGKARISEANMIHFASVEEAEAAGYTKALTCK